MGERWLVVAEFPDYEVGSLGNVRRRGEVARNRQKILKGWIANGGYLMVRLYKDGHSRSRLIHRLVCIAFRGEPPTDKHHASHKDGDRLNNVLGNIRWMTPSANNMEKHKHGTMRTGDNHPTRYMPECVSRGSKHGNAKLNEAAVTKIRTDMRSCPAIAAEYGVDSSLIAMVKQRKIWKHVP